ncbi:hypothetical protein C5S32_02875 [ANME-1 cluster archaeon GoMg1]|nr:hypothetical protein [ANME-1 cluster archaeon GoMg1]
MEHASGIVSRKKRKQLGGGEIGKDEETFSCFCPSLGG